VETTEPRGGASHDTMDAADLAESIERVGFAIVPGVIDGAAVDRVFAALDHALTEDGAPGDRPRRGYAMRNLMARVPAVRELAESQALRSLAAAVLGPGAFCVRGLLFDKLPGANWHVGWHQDRAIAVRAQVEVEGFGPWSVKAGVAHVEPPVDVLERMVTLRVHLDDCDEDNGPLRVMPGSHRGGKLGGESVRRWIDECGAVTCRVPHGGVVIMRPLVLHASSPARRPEHRRVVHLEYAADALPGGLHWYEADRGAGSLSPAPRVGRPRQTRAAHHR
jgi:Phytanoyl-CoA dioxygenase (PhyH)